MSETPERVKNPYRCTDCAWEGYGVNEVEECPECGSKNISV